MDRNAAARREVEEEQSEGLLQQRPPRPGLREGSPHEHAGAHDATVAGEEMDLGGSRPALPLQTKPQSSIARPRPTGTPRTPNRVRFDVAEPARADGEGGHARPPGAYSWLEEAEDVPDDETEQQGRGPAVPLLRDIEAPSVTLANDIDAEEFLETARPKSGLCSAFMNMANSIIGAGIIGQPYAFKQAGLLTGVVLLLGLTITVDWTIRLIVVNSKLSGADSFQATMEKCFGKSGLVAISVAQWAFAFGGMVAFCIIIGDTIPHVIAAAFPSLRHMPILWLLTNRRAIIAMFVLGLSYPLSLYRDIAMVSARRRSTRF